MRSPAGAELILQNYRRPFLKPGESRRPMLTFPRELPLEGEPADVVALIEANGRWLSRSDVPKLFVNAEPGSILVGRQRSSAAPGPTSGR